VAAPNLMDTMKIFQGVNTTPQSGTLQGGGRWSQLPTQTQMQQQRANIAGNMSMGMLQDLLTQQNKANQPQSWQQQAAGGINQFNQMGQQPGGWRGRDIGQMIGSGIGLGASALTGGAAAPLFAPVGGFLGNLAGGYFEEDPAVAQQRHQQQLNQQYMQQYQPIADEARREFNQQTLPGLESQLASMGPGMERSGALNALRERARTNLESKLAAGQAQNLMGFRNADLQQQGLANQLMGMRQQGQYQQGMLGLKGQELAQNQQQNQGDLAYRLLMGSLGNQFENQIEDPEGITAGGVGSGIKNAAGGFQDWISDLMGAGRGQGSASNYESAMKQMGQRESLARRLGIKMPNSGRLNFEDENRGRYSGRGMQ